MPKQCKYWYFEECPFIKDCSVKSWKRAKCGGKTPAMAKEALKQHLMRSDFHKLSDEHASIVVCDTEMKSCMMDDEEIDETKVDETKVKVEVDKKKVKVEVGTKKVKVEEVDKTKSSSVILCSNKKRKLDDSDQVKDEEVDDEAKSSSVVLYSNKKPKLDDNDLDKLLFDATNKVQQGLDCIAIAQINMREAKLALQRISKVVDSISRSRGSVVECD